MTVRELIKNLSGVSTASNLAESLPRVLEDGLVFSDSWMIFPDRIVFPESGDSVGFEV